MNDLEIIETVSKAIKLLEEAKNTENGFQFNEQLISKAQELLRLVDTYLSERTK